MFQNFLKISPVFLIIFLAFFGILSCDCEDEEKTDDISLTRTVAMTMIQDPGHDRDTTLEIPDPGPTPDTTDMESMSDDNDERIFYVHLIKDVGEKSDSFYVRFNIEIVESSKAGRME